MLETFVWSDLFETGIAKIDLQHRRLVELLNALGRDVDSATPEHIDRSLLALAEYTVYHFGSEEGIMAANNVAAAHADRHRETHRRFVRQVTDWIERRKNGEAIGLPSLLEFLSNWLVFHILGDDQSLGRQVLAIQTGNSPHAAYEQDRVSDDPRTDILLGSLRRLYGGLVARNEELIAAHRELADINTTLELRVAERTADLTEANRRLQEEQAKVLEAEKMASLGRMVAGFAHEINTPIGVAVGAVSHHEETLDRIDRLLADEEVSEEALRSELVELRKCGTLALNNLRRAANLVQSFKRTSVDQTSEQVRAFDMRELIDDVVLSLHSVLKRLPIEIAVSCPADLRLVAIPGLLEQVLTNLVMNAIQHAYDGGARAGTISIDVTLAGDEVHMVFADDGVGMSDEQIANAFEPFYTTKRGQGGSGLGLYLCYNIVTVQLGGTLACASQPGKGCRFDIRFPAHRSESAQT